MLLWAISACPLPFSLALSSGTAEGEGQGRKENFALNFLSERSWNYLSCFIQPEAFITLFRASLYDLFHRAFS